MRDGREGDSRVGGGDARVGGGDARVGGGPLPSGADYVTADMAAGPQPSREQLERLRAAGFRTIVNLRRAGEKAQPMSPKEEGEEVRALGMEYLHIPVHADRVEPAHLDRFHEALERLPGPAFIHCATADRAVAFATARESLRTGVDPDELLAEAADRGLECGDGLATVVRAYVDERGARAAGKPEAGRSRP